MRIYFACPMVEARKAHWYPLINTYRNETLDSFPCVWKPARQPEKWCVGQAEVDATQLAALAADPDIQITIDTDDRKLKDTQPAQRLALDSFCEKIGMEKGGDEETFREYCDKMAVKARGNGFTNLDVELAIQVQWYNKIAANRAERERRGELN